MDIQTERRAERKVFGLGVACGLLLAAAILVASNATSGDWIVGGVAVGLLIGFALGSLLVNMRRAHQTPDWYLALVWYGAVGLALYIIIEGFGRMEAGLAAGVVLVACVAWYRLKHGRWLH